MVEIGINIKKRFVDVLMTQDLISTRLCNIPLYIGEDLNVKYFKVDSNLKVIKLPEFLLGDFLSVYLIQTNIDEKATDLYFCFKNDEYKGIDFIIKIPEIGYESLIFAVSEYNIKAYLRLLVGEEDMKPYDVESLLNHIIMVRKKDMTKVAYGIKSAIKDQVNNLMKLNPRYFFTVSERL